MRQLKITKSNRKPLIQVNEYLISDSFNLEEFARLIPEMEQAVERDAEFLVEVFQDLEHSCVLAMSHLHGKSYEELIAELRECGEEIDKLRWLCARNVLAISQEYQGSAMSMRELLLAGMQGVKNAAFAYNFNPDEDFESFAAPIIRKHIELYVQTGVIPYAQPGNEYEEIHAKAFDSYCEHCHGNGGIEKFMRVNSDKLRAQLFATAKIGRCHKELVKVADLVEWKMVDAALHLPDDYDERDKYIRTQPYMVHDARYDGECKDLVKPVGSEWCICVASGGERIPINQLTDRESMCNAMEALCVVLSNLMKKKIVTFREWRAATGH